MSDFLANKKILLPFDFSDPALAAVDEALQMADKTTRLSVFHVLVPLHVISIEPGLIADLGSNAERIAGAINGMKKLINDPGRVMEFDARIGDAGTEIVNYAKEIEADLIVMPSHGRTGISRLLLGSVAERVIRLAECPVMVLRKPKQV